MGIAPKANPVHVAVAAWPWGAYLGAEGLEKGIRVQDLVVHAPPRQRHHVRRQGHAATTSIRSSPTRKPRTTATTRRCCSTRRATWPRAPARTSSSSSNGELYTPDLDSARWRASRATRSSTLARDLGITVIEKRITRDEVYCADEAFFTGTAAEVTPIRELDNRQIGAGRRGPITTQAAGAVLRHGERPQSAPTKHWLTQV